MPSFLQYPSDILSKSLEDTNNRTLCYDLSGWPMILHYRMKTLVTNLISSVSVNANHERPAKFAGKMTTTLKVSQCIETPSKNLHFVPAEIQHNGQANIKSYFEPTVREENGSMWFVLK